MLGPPLLQPSCTSSGTMFLRSLISVFLLCFELGLVELISQRRPHIVVIIADDLGWNDVGYHGSNEIRTPNIDALAYNGLILNRHYTQSTCTPSRAALMTGKYPIRMGLQGLPIAEGIPIAVSLNETLMPQYLKELGYITRLVGKWHLGSYKNEFTPTERGFDSFFGYYNGWVRYNDSICGSELISNMSGIDARENYAPAGHRFYNKYNTDVFTDEAVDIINEHNSSVPLFLDISYTAVHAIIKRQLQVRNFTENEERFAYIKDPNRRMLAGVLAALDESVGRIIHALHQNKMIQNTIVLFMSDNGGQTLSDGLSKGGMFQNFASNWPLRGLKGSVAEGAVRGVAAIWSPLLQHRNIVQKKIHLVDWLPTFYVAAGGNTSHLGRIDGISQWDLLAGKETKTPRNRILININEVTGDKAFIAGKWKYIRGKGKPRLRYGGYAGRDNVLVYNLTLVLDSITHKVLRKYRPKKSNRTHFLHLRHRANIALAGSCQNRTNVMSEDVLPCFATGCLFNIIKDPCEMVDLSAAYPKAVQNVRNILRDYERELRPQYNCTKDENANPKYFDNYWTPWIATEPTTCVE